MRTLIKFHLLVIWLYDIIIKYTVRMLRIFKLFICCLFLFVTNLFVVAELARLLIVVHTLNGLPLRVQISLLPYMLIWLAFAINRMYLLTFVILFMLITLVLFHHRLIVLQVDHTFAWGEHFIIKRVEDLLLRRNFLF